VRVVMARFIHQLLRARVTQREPPSVDARGRELKLVQAGEWLSSFSGWFHR